MTKQVIDYIKKVTGFHKSRPKYMAMLSAALQPLVDANNFTASIPSFFDLDSAVGVQLDVVGEWVNETRQVKVPIPNPWFSWDDYNRGWDRGVWFQPYDVGNTIYNLNDDYFRRLIKAKIAADNWDGSLQSVYTIYNTLFDNPNVKLIVDDKMALQVIFALTKFIPDSITLELFSRDYLPLTPSGIKKWYFVTSIQNVPIFGWDMSNDQVAGWGAGAWGVTPDELIQNPPDSSVYGHQLDFSKKENSGLISLIGI